MILRMRLMCLALVIVPIGFSIRAAAAQSSSPIVVAIDPANVTVAAGQTVDVAVVVRDVTDLYAFDAQVGFDPSVVQVVDADPALNGTQVSLGVFLESGFVIRNQVDNTAGTLQLAMTQLNPSTAKTGTGNLVVFKLRGIKSGSVSPLTLQAQLAQRDGTLLTTAPTSGQVQVSSASVSGPTTTPIPTQGAGTPLPTGTIEANIAPVATSIPPTVPVATGSTITPQPTNTPAAAVASAPSATASDPSLQSAAPAETPAVTLAAVAAHSVDPTAASGSADQSVTSTSSAKSAVPSAAGGTPAAQVTAEPSAASANNAGSSAMGLVVVAGLIGLAGIVVVLIVMRKQER